MTNTSPPPLRRLDQGRWLAGVAGGLALRLGPPVWIVRVGFVLLIPLFGLGPLLYLVGWLFIPREGETHAPIRRWLRTRQARRWLGVVLIGIAVIVLGSETGLIRGDLAFALVLIGIGLLLYRGDLGPAGQRPPTTHPDTSPSQPPEQLPPPGSAEEDADGPPVSPSEKDRLPRRPRSFLGRVSLGFAIAALGLLGLLDTVLPGFHPDVRHYLAVFVAVIGAGLVVGAWFGRSRGLIAAGVVMMPVLVLSPITDLVDLRSIGDRYHRPATVDEVRDVYRVGLGTMVIDLRDVDFEGRTLAVKTGMGVGRLLVRPPPDLAAEVTGRVGIGRLRVGEFSRYGFGVQLDRHLEGAGGRLLLDVDAGIGDIEVNTWPSMDPWDP